MSSTAFVLDYKASPTAAAFHRDNSFFRGLRGPVGSGKSITCLIEIFHRASRQKPGRMGIRKTRFAVVRNSYPELKSTTLKSWQEWFPEEICPVRTNESPMTGRLRLPLPDNTSIDMEILFIALDKPRDIAKLLSLELTGAFVNETKEVQKEVVDTLTSRVGRYPSMRDGGPTWSGVWCDTNAPSDMHFWAELEKDPPMGWKFFVQPSALLEDDSAPNGYRPNPKAENIANLPGGHQYYLNLVAGKDANWVRAYVLNNFAATMAGKPVFGGDWNEQLHVNPLPLIPIKGHEVVVGLDFGLTPAAVFTQMVDGRLRVLDELAAKRMGLEQFLISDVLQLIGQKYYDYNIFFSGDPSGMKGSDTDERTCFQVLSKLGLRAAPAFANNLEARLGSVRGFLTRLVGGKPAMLVSPTCRGLINGFNGEYMYAKLQLSGETRYRDKPEKNQASHVHDACQYACMRWDIMLRRQEYAAEVYMPPADTADAHCGY